MGRAKGKARKLASVPFTAHVRYNIYGQDKDDDRELRSVDVEVTLATSGAEIKRRIAAARPDLRADRIKLTAEYKEVSDDKTLSETDPRISKDSPFTYSIFQVYTVQPLDGERAGEQVAVKVHIDEGMHGLKGQILNELGELQRLDGPLHEAYALQYDMTLVLDGNVLRKDDKVADVVTEQSIVHCVLRKPAHAHREARRWWKLVRCQCDVCGLQRAIREESFPVCDSCGRRRYCSVECQREDWQGGHDRQCQFYRDDYPWEEMATMEEEEYGPF